MPKATKREELWVEQDTPQSNSHSSKKPAAKVVAGKQKTKKNASAGSGKKEEESRVVYIGHLPSSFVEGGLRGYFSQFGDITRLRVARSKRSAKPKGYAFIEFADANTAKVAALTMNKYPLEGKLLVSHVVPAEKQHPKLWNGATNRKFVKRDWRAVAYKMQGRAKTLTQQLTKIARLIRSEQAAADKLAELGIDYTPPSTVSYAAQAAEKGLDVLLHGESDDEGSDIDVSDDEDLEWDEEIDEDDDDDGDDDEAPRKKAGTTSDDDDDEDEEDEADDDDDDDSDVSAHSFDEDGEEETSAPPSKRARTAAAKPPSSSEIKAEFERLKELFGNEASGEDDSDADGEESPKKPAKKSGVVDKKSSKPVAKAAKANTTTNKTNAPATKSQTKPSTSAPAPVKATSAVKTGKSVNEKTVKPAESSVTGKRSRSAVTKTTGKR